MTKPTIDAVVRLVGALKGECERGHISDERGEIYSACRALEIALEHEPTEPLAAWPCTPPSVTLPNPAATPHIPPAIEPTIGNDPVGGSYKVNC